MKTILFNFLDLVLITTLCLCGLLAWIAATSRYLQPASRPLLAVFFVLNGMVTFETLVFWGESLKYAAFDLSPWLLTGFSTATFALGPILLWSVAAELRTQSSPKQTSDRSASLTWSRGNWLSYLHLIPALLTPLYLYSVCYRFPLEVQHELLLNLSIYSVPEAHFFLFISIKYLLPVIYGMAAITLIYREPKDSRMAAGKHRYLLLFCLTYGAIRAWILLTHFSSLWLPVGWSDLMGIVSNGLTLVLLMAGVYLHIRLSQQSRMHHLQAENSHQGDNLDAIAAAAEEQAKMLEIAERIQTMIASEQPHLNPRLTLERFAETLDIPARQVSQAINRCFEQNFHEFINRHRIDEAKRLLSNIEFADLSIIDVAARSGFNSKATFNRIFKNHINVTPTTYRQQHSAQPPSLPQ